VEFTDKISALIFALVLISAVVYVIMSKYVIGPIVNLKSGEKVVLVISVIGIVTVVVYAAAELLFRVVF
jgi:hypothetical protein